jgi:hypothetical protein
MLYNVMVVEKMVGDTKDGRKYEGGKKRVDEA